MYASLSARCHASSPIDRPLASGRKSYCVAGSARNSFSVLSASRSQALRNISSSFIGIRHLLVKRSVPRTTCHTTINQATHENAPPPVRRRYEPFTKNWAAGCSLENQTSSPFRKVIGVCSSLDGGTDAQQETPKVWCPDPGDCPYDGPCAGPACADRGGERCGEHRHADPACDRHFPGECLIRSLLRDVSGRRQPSRRTRVPRAARHAHGQWPR